MVSTLDASPIFSSIIVCTLNSPPTDRTTIVLWTALFPSFGRNRSLGRYTRQSMELPHSTVLDEHASRSFPKMESEV